MKNKNETIKDKIVDGKMTKGKAVTEIKNQLRRKKEQQTLTNWLKNNPSDSQDFDKTPKNSTKSEADISGGCLIVEEQGYQGDGTEWIYEKDENGTIYRRAIGSDKRENVN
jgi:hypothetical protein